MRLLTNIGRLWTGAREGAETDAAVLLDGDRIAWTGPTRPGPPTAIAARERDIDDCADGVVTPGLVDAHTHPVYAGDRSAEIALRSAGAGYAEIAEAGGGIGATVAATRSARLSDLEAAAAARLRRWLAAGTTTVEAKTGYHLHKSGEVAVVRMLSELSSRPGLPHLEVTFLGAHAVPPEMAGADDYVAEVTTWAPQARAAGARFCDVFCDEGYFSPEQAGEVLRAGQRAGLVARVHADELAHTGGARVAAELGAASADHLLRADEDDARALAAAGVTAVLAPGTALAMGQTPPVEALAGHGVTLALGTDHNPGTSGLMSMSLVVALAVAVFGLSVDAALRAATVGGAASLRLGDRGTIVAGKRADLVRWDAEHEGAFAWAYGLRPLETYKDGAPVSAGGAPVA